MIASLLSKLAQLLNDIGPRNIILLVGLFEAILKAPNKKDAIRAATIAASHQAGADAMLSKMLKKRKRRK